MAEILGIDEALETLRSFGPLRRILLATPGTLQSTLAAYFGVPVDVEVVSQEAAGPGAFLREVRLVRRDTRAPVCRASTRIDVEDERVRKLVDEKRAGLGQISERLGLRASFELLEAAADADSFSRVYALSGPGFRFRIREQFPAALYPEDPR